MAESISSKTTERSTQILRLQFSFSKASRQWLFLKIWLLEGDSEEVEGVLWDLVFLGMVLGYRPKHKAKEKTQKNTKGRLQVSTGQKNIEQKLYDTWTI